jgi:LacI family transcriptional regulator
LQIASRQSTDATAIDDVDVRAATQFIAEHVVRRISVEDILGHVAVSRRMLEWKFISILGRTLFAEIERAQLEHVQRLLLETDWSIKTIAEKCGYSSQEAFTVVFRRWTGLTATEFRRRNRPS